MDGSTFGVEEVVETCNCGWLTPLNIQVHVDKHDKHKMIVELVCPICTARLTGNLTLMSGADEGEF